MRTFEIVLWFIAFGWTAATLFNKWSPRIHAVTALATIGVVVAHGALEGARAQMILIYALLAILLTATAWRIMTGRVRIRRSRWVRLAWSLPLAVSLAVGAILPSLFPVFEYDSPAGPYGVGTAVYELKRAPADRDLVMQVWYPVSRDAHGIVAGITTHPALLEIAYASFTGLPQPLFDNLRLIKTHAILNAAMAPDPQRFSVVLFSHGPLGANRSQSIFQMEALASAGFVTVAIDHTGYASTTIFPDGHALPAGADAAWPVFVDDRSTAMMNTWVSDVRFVLDRLEALDLRDPANILTGRLDLDRVGYVGASFGGSVVVQALLDEPRIKAGVAEDGKPYFSPNTLTDLRRPLMYMQSAAPYIKSTDAQLARWGLTGARFKAAEQDHYARQMELFGRSQGPIYNVYIRRTNHVTFSDLDLILRMPDSQLMDIRRAHRIINDYTMAFFGRYLNGDKSSLVDGETPSPYEEVTVASRNVVPVGQLVQRRR